MHLLSQGESAELGLLLFLSNPLTMIIYTLLQGESAELRRTVHMREASIRLFGSQLHEVIDNVDNPAGKRVYIILRCSSAVRVVNSFD